MRPPRLYIVILCSLLTFNAFATVITIDPNDYTSGTDISFLTGGVTLQTVIVPQFDYYGADGYGPKIPLETSSVYAALCSPCRPFIDSQNVFGNDGFGGSPSTVFFDANKVGAYMANGVGYPGSVALRAEFDKPTNFVEVTIGGALTGNFSYLTLWDISGKQITSGLSGFGSQMNAGGNPGEPCDRTACTFDFTSVDANIAMIIAGGYGGGEYIENMSFNRAQVSETSSIALLGVGLVALIARASIKTKTTVIERVI